MLFYNDNSRLVHCWSLANYPPVSCRAAKGRPNRIFHRHHHRARVIPAPRYAPRALARRRQRCRSWVMATPNADMIQKYSETAVRQSPIRGTTPRGNRRQSGHPRISIAPYSNHAETVLAYPVCPRRTPSKASIRTHTNPVRTHLTTPMAGMRYVRKVTNRQPCVPFHFSFSGSVQLIFD